MKLFFFLVVLGLGQAAFGQCFTNVTLTAPFGTNLTTILTVETNQILRCTYLHFQPGAGSFSGADLLINIPGAAVTQIRNQDLTNGVRLPLIIGPATIELNGTIASGGKTTATFELSALCTEITPSGNVVIPTEPAGNVDIKLESSADLVSWNSAMPGTYGSGLSNRFFRVRAERQ